MQSLSCLFLLGFFCSPHRLFFVPVVVGFELVFHHRLQPRHKRSNILLPSHSQYSTRRLESYTSRSCLKISSVSNNNDSEGNHSWRRAASAEFSSSSILPDRHVRWHTSSSSAPSDLNSIDDTWSLQTAVTTWRHPKTGQTVELHALVHFGDEEYYKVYNQNENNQQNSNDPGSLLFSKNKKRIVLYELLLGQDMLETDETRPWYRRVKKPLRASPVDQQTAARYKWACQVDVLDYQQPGWIHADWTREEFQQTLQQRQAKQSKNNDARNDSRPLWQQAVSSPSAATEAATALFVGPPTLSDKDVARRLFSNLFLPGSSLTQVLRLALWLTVPAPELSILLVDWSATTSSRNLWQASWSPIVRFLLQALWEARLDVIQRLAFGQVLLTGSRPTSSTTTSSTNENLAQSLLIQGRNQQALRVLDQVLQDQQQESSSVSTPPTIALLYGSSHCTDLSKSLQQRGFVLQSTAWRTAWSVQLQSSGTKAWTAPLWILPVSLYLAASGADWLASWQAVRSADTAGDVAILAAAYGIRHVLLYLALSKVVLDWQKARATVESG